MSFQERHKKAKKADLRMSIDQVAEICGCFTDCETNNGYGCNHPKNEDGSECHRHSCPVAFLFDDENDIMEVTDPEVIKKIEALL
ncbi:MAG: hypothetical protein WC998_03380 [Candidatus Paceibacterota bacterium]|jgi:hypothetical protein